MTNKSYFEEKVRSFMKDMLWALPLLALMWFWVWPVAVAIMGIWFYNVLLYNYGVANI